jgi:hypothetical protein
MSIKGTDFRKPLAFLAAIIGISMGSAALANSLFTPVYNPTIEISRASGSIEIDGDLSDAGWRGAARATNFVEHSPGDQIKPPVESEAWTTYDDNNFYLAFIAYDDPGTIRTSLRERDNIFRDDYFGILFDTYGDLAWGYEIFVNPYGIQGDLRQLSNGGEDMSFDVVFESKGMVTDSGYQVELAIPFASLRFPNKEKQEWKVNFWRDHQREFRRRYSWAAIDRDNPCWMCQWGTMTGIEGIKPSSNIELLPNVVAFQSGERLYNDEETSSDFVNSDPDAKFSLNGRWGLSSDASIEATLNPDFSQVESDAAQVDVNTTFALFYPERRPFFQRGSDMYDSWINAIHTRSINDPEVAAKFTGSFDGTSVAYIFARDEHSPITLPFEETSRHDLLGKSTSNIARVKKSFGEGSFIGALATDRRIDDGGAGTVFGGDVSFRFLKNYRVDVQALFSRTEEPVAEVLSADDSGKTFYRGKHTWELDGETFSGHAVMTRIQRNARLWSFNLNYRAHSPTFRTDNGFTNQNDNQMATFWTGLSFRPNRYFLIEWQPSINLGREANFNKPLSDIKDEWVNGSLYFRLRGQTDVNLNYLNSRELFRGHFHEGISRLSLNISSRPCEMISGGFGLTTGRTISRNSADSSVMGDMLDFDMYLNFKPSQRLFITPTFIYSRLDHSDAYLSDNPDTAKNIYDGYILRARLNYQFTRELFLRMIVQYNDFSESLDIEPLLTYQINPFTVFYVGATQNRGQWDYATGPGSDTRTSSTSELSSRQFFAKFQYLFRL